MIIIITVGLFILSCAAYFIVRECLDLLKRKKYVKAALLFIGYMVVYETYVYFDNIGMVEMDNVTSIVFWLFLLSSYLSAHYSILKPNRIRLEEVKNTARILHKYDKEKAESLRTDLKYGKDIARAGAICLSIFIMSIAMKVKQTTERTNDDLRYFVERSLNDTMSIAFAITSIVFVLIFIYFIIDIYFWVNRGIFHGYVVRPIIMFGWMIIFAIVIAQYR